MFDVNKYETWLFDRKTIKYNRNVSLELKKKDAEIIFEYGLPESIFSFYFLNSSEGGLKRLNDYYTRDFNDYDESFYEENVEYLKKYIVIGTSLGSAICLNQNGQIEEIDYENFSATFVNESLEEFLSFLMIYGQMIKTVEDEQTAEVDIECLTQKQVEETKIKMEKQAISGWEKYEFWIDLLDFLEEESLNFND